MTITHIQSIADGGAADQVPYHDEGGWTALMRACIQSAPLALVQLMITKAKLNSRKRRQLAITQQQ